MPSRLLQLAKPKEKKDKKKKKGKGQQSQTAGRVMKFKQTHFTFSINVSSLKMSFENLLTGLEMNLEIHLQISK